MPGFTAKDVQALRQATGAGMMDAKKALEASDGDSEAAALWLRERGLGKASERTDRSNAEGAVAIGTSGNVATLVLLKSETDFGAKSAQFVELADAIAQDVAERGEAAVADRQKEIDDLKITLKENIELGQVYRFEAGEGAVLDTYIHIQNGRGVNGVMVELAGGSRELAHDIAVHIAFARPATLTRDEVAAADIAAEREALTNQTRNEGKPDAALPKIVEGKLNGWYKRVPGGSLVEQPFARDDKQSVQQVLGDARVIRFAQVVVGD